VARVLMVSSEAAPLAKTGGLADVVGALPLALRPYGDETAVVIPRYGFIDLKSARRVWEPVTVFLGPSRYETVIYQAPEEYPLYLVDCPALYDRKELYNQNGTDYPDNHIRFAVLARAALAVARRLFRTDIFHCHDWQAGLVPAYLRTTFGADPTFLGTKTLFTIHNLGYRGLFPPSAMAEVALDSRLYHPDGMEFFGQLSYIKGGIAFADALNTVSPTYAREIQTPEYGFGLDGALRARANVLSGILNGVDYREWNPETDPLIPANYSAHDLSGKAKCKERLLAEFGLPATAMDSPLIGIVTRFAEQKGMDLVAEVAGSIVADGFAMIVVGTGEAEYEDFFHWLAAAHPDRVSVRIDFDNGLAHRVEAGADLFLMPSRYEPCGLNQIYSLRYGTVPVVRATGGLDDTIEEATGFKFREYSGRAFLEAIRKARAEYAQGDLWKARMLRGMAEDFSWSRSAGAYSALYRQLLGLA
jgi:starch synthase